jgi:hypothetical protein
MRHRLILAAFCLVSFTSGHAASGADAVRDADLVPFAFPDSVASTGVRATCGFDGPALPDNVTVLAAGAYSGRKSDILIDASGHKATRFDVVVNSPARPVALVLGAYEPALWNVGWTEGTKVAAVVVTGYGAQVVAGLPKGTPRLITTFDNRGPCGFTYVVENHLAELNPFARKVFGKPVDMVYIAREGRVVVGDPPAAGARMVTSPDTPPERLVVKGTPLPKANAMSCSKRAGNGKAVGEFACYGLWDYGDAFGNDENMCSGSEDSSYSKAGTGCIISAAACASGKAIASRAISVSGASAAEVDLLAERLNATPAQVRKELITVWEYRCVSPDTKPPPGDVPPVFSR